MTRAPHSPRPALLALTASLIASCMLTACAPPPVRRDPDPGPIVAQPVSVSPELERAPEPAPARAQPEPQRPVAQANPPATIPPARTSPSTDQPASQPPPTPPDDWWLHKPAPVPGRIRLVATATGQTLREARRAAVDQGLEDLRQAAGEEPKDVQYELTSVQRDTPGLFRGYVLVSCQAP